MNSGVYGAIFGSRGAWVRVVKVAAAIVNLAVLVLVFDVLWMALYQVRKDNYWVMHTSQVKTILRDVGIGIADCESNQRSYLLTGNEIYIRYYELAKRVIRSSVSELATMTRDNPAQQERVAGVSALVGEKIRFMDRFLVDRKKFGKEWREYDMTHGLVILSDIRLILARMDREEDALLSDRKEKFDSTIVNLIVSVVVLIVLGVLLAVGIIAGTIEYFRETVAVMHAADGGAKAPPIPADLGEDFGYDDGE
jgi:CHASE3 domain sensor protein